LVGEPSDGRIGALLDHAVRSLATHSPTARLDAEVLLAFCADLSRSTLIAFPERGITHSARARFVAAVERRARGEPVAYIRGEKEFYSLPLRVTPSVLIPRADTEVLVDAALQCLDAGERCSVLDIGTGSGAIALAIKRERPLATVTALDCDRAALAVARDNSLRLGLEIRCVQSNWLDALPGERFDLVVSNPPYVPSTNVDLDGPLRFEPRVALDGGSDGLDAYRALMGAASAHLTARGLLVLEHGHDQRSAVLALAAANGLALRAVHDDLAGIPRVAVFCSHMLSGRLHPELRHAESRRRRRRHSETRDCKTRT
jgi:release factor glutamine methyltransferase